MPSIALRDSRFAQTANRNDFEKSVAEKGIKIFSKEYTNALMSMCQWADIIIFWASHREQDIEWIKICHSFGKKVVTDCDDMYDCKDQPWITNKPVYFSNVLMQRKIFNMVDGITVTTDGLKKHYQQFTDTPIFVLPNMADWNYDRWLMFGKKPNQKTRIGYMGAPFHYHDLEQLYDLFPCLLKKYPEVELDILGMTNERLLELQNDFKNRVILHSKSEKGYKFLPFMEFTQYLYPFDIGIIPITDWEFNTLGKSDIKFLEYTMANVATVASDLKPYSESITDGYNGFLARNLKDWQKKLEILITDKQKRKELLSNAKKYIFQHRTIQRNIHLWAETYEKVMNNAA